MAKPDLISLSISADKLISYCETPQSFISRSFPLFFTFHWMALVCIIDSFYTSCFFLPMCLTDSHLSFLEPSCLRSWDLPCTEPCTVSSHSNTVHTCHDWQEGQPSLQPLFSATMMILFPNLDCPPMCLVHIMWAVGFSCVEVSLRTALVICRMKWCWGVKLGINVAWLHQY